MRKLLAAPALLLCLVAGSVAAAGPDAPADLETAPILSGGDDAHDAAIWVHPTDPARSLVIGTDKHAALEVYDLQGNRVQRITGIQPNMVDVRDDIVGAADDDIPAAGTMRFWKVDPATGRLSRFGTIATDSFREHGFCMYKAGGKLYAFPNSGGLTEQWELDTSGATISGRRVRGPWRVGVKIEGCAADDATGKLYVVEEMVGIWEYGAGAADSTTARVQVDRNGPGGHLEDVESVAVTGDFLIASSEGDSTFVTYDTRTRAFVGKLALVAGAAADGCERPEGIEASAASFNPTFPNGLFVCKDRVNTLPGSTGNQNFKYARLERIVPLAPRRSPAPVGPPRDTARQSDARVIRIATRRRVSIREARRRGVRMSAQITPWRDAKSRVVRTRLYTARPRRLVANVYRTLRSTTVFRMTLRSASLRRGLRPGRYVLEVAAGPNRRRLGRALVHRFTIAR